MKKRTVLLSALLGLGLAASAQVKAGAETLSDNFWTKVDYIGAMGAEDWTVGWTNYDADKIYAATQVTIGNGVQSVSGGYHITKDTTWKADKAIKLSGWIIVDSLQTLTIEAGALIRGEVKSGIMVKRGGKLVANGTKEKPIIMTSNNDPGKRTNYDWGGIIICGNAPNNNGSMAQYEGIADLYYGAVNGGKADDNSGSLKYVRIEHACIDFGASKEVNALTLCAVGSGTTIDYVQTAFSGDDAFEFFGGTVNAKHIVAYATEDDDFDTDNGWAGKVQFAIAMRNPNMVDSDPARGFESDNDANGSTASPVTNGTFSNVTVVGPRQQDSWTVANWAAKHDASMYLRRNTQLKIWNSLFIGNARGLVIDGAATVQNAKDDKLQVKYTTLAGIAQTDEKVCDTASVKKAWTPADVKAWFVSNHGEIKTSIMDVELTDPFTLSEPIFTAEDETYARNKSCWSDAYVVFPPKTAVGETQATEVVPSLVNDVITVTGSAVVYNVMGAVVAEGQNSISAANLPAGLYIVKTATQSVIVKK